MGTAHRLATTTLLLALAAAGCTITGPSEPPTASPSVEPTGQPAEPDGVPQEAAAERDGVIFRVAVDRDAIAPGGLLRIVLEAENTGPGIVAWAGNECQIVSAATVDGPPLPPEPAGLRWDGDAAVLRELALLDAGIADPLTPGAFARGELATGCDAMFVVSELAPGATVRFEAIWPAATRHGVPARPGGYRLDAVFDYLGPFGPGGATPDEIRPIRIGLPFRVVGAPFAGIPAAAAIDAVLAHPAFAAWLAGVPRTRWSSSSLRYTEGVWQFALDIDMARQRAHVTVDPGTGRVVDFVVLAGVGS